MQKTVFPFAQVGALAHTDVAYAESNPALRSFYQYEPNIAGLRAAIEDRLNRAYPRADLVAALREQYRDADTSALEPHFEALLRNDTFTITTAHQPALLLGPLFFIYKAITTIQTAAALQRDTGKHIVPVFVLGSEDHDLDELNHANLFNRKIVWEPNETGPVGSMSTESLGPVLETLRPVLGESANAQALMQIIEEAYNGATTFAVATQRLLHALLGRFGLVVLNMSTPLLKQHFIPVMRDELLQQSSHRLVNETTTLLRQAGFKTQAAPREINLFYLTPGRRDRIVKLADGRYQIGANSDTSEESGSLNQIFTEEKILSELNFSSEKFSPNVILRPLYQELVLPNLAYVGGGGELAYWLERKAVFDHFGIPYPVLIRRHSVLWLDKDSNKRLQKLGFKATQFFDDTDALVRQYIDNQSTTEINLSAEIEDLKQIFERIATKAMATDPTLEKAARADAVKTVGLLEQWEGRLVRAEKQKHEVALNQLRALKEKLFPGNGLQERTDNFIPYYLKYGPAFFDTLQEQLQAFDAGFVVLSDVE